jgi:hypothetical protein
MRSTNSRRLDCNLAVSDGGCALLPEFIAVAALKFNLPFCKLWRIVQGC